MLLVPDVTGIDRPESGTKLMNMPRKKPSPVPSNSTPKGGAAAAVVRKIVELHGGKRTITQMLGNSISRPLLVAICKGQRATTATTIAELCRVCPNHLAEELIAAHLQDEVGRIEGRFPSAGTLWSEAAPWCGEAKISITPSQTSKADTDGAKTSARAAARRLTTAVADQEAIRRKARGRRKLTS